MKRFAFLLCLFALAAASANASTIVYNNATSDSYTNPSYTISYGYSTANSFSLTSSATIDAISFGNWLNSGDTLESVDWEITTAPNGGTILESGTATAFSNEYENSLDGHTIDDSTFSIGNLSLTADTTYYLELSDAVTEDDGGAAWDESNNPDSSGSFYFDGSLVETIPSETFALYSPVPEPPGLLLLGSGLAGLLLFSRMLRRAMAAPRCA